MRKQLEDERRSKKELSSLNVVLNGKLRVGHEAIKAEMEHTQELQKQLEALRSEKVPVTLAVTITPDSCRSDGVMPHNLSHTCARKMKYPRS